MLNPYLFLKECAHLRGSFAYSLGVRAVLFVALLLENMQLVASSDVPSPLRTISVFSRGDRSMCEHTLPRNLPVQ